MAKKTYAAMFEPTKSGGYGISFPDLPGCVSFGADLSACVKAAEEALSLHLEGMAEDGEVFPSETWFGDLIGQMGLPPGVVWSAITVEAPDAADRVNVYLPRSLLERVDRFVAEHAPMNRSTFFSEAAREKLSSARRPNNPFNALAKEQTATISDQLGARVRTAIAQTEALLNATRITLDQLTATTRAAEGIQPFPRDGAGGVIGPAVGVAGNAVEAVGIAGRGVTVSGTASMAVGIAVEAKPRGRKQ